MRRTTPLIIAEHDGKRFIDWNAMPIEDLVYLSLDGVSFAVNDGRIVATFG